MVLDSVTERMARKLIETTDEGVILAASFLILSRDTKHESVVVTEDRYYTLKELMYLWKCSYSYLSRQINGGKLRAIKLGKSYRVSEKERIRFELENQRKFSKNKTA